MSHRRLYVLLAVAAWGCPEGSPGEASTAAEGTALGPDRLTRVVSLSPQITETIAALGAADHLVAVSDYCRRPPEACDRPRVGHALRPDLEAIAGARPELIVYEATVQGPGADLSRLAPVDALPWLTLDQVGKAVLRIGERLGRPEQAADLVGTLRERLGRPARPDGPEVLLILGYPEASGTFWFVKADSLHGHLVPAAGGRPPPEIIGWKGPPKMTAEDLVRLDPEWIVILAREDQEGSMAGIEQLTPLQAIRNGRLRRLVADDVFSSGPALLNSIEPLAAMLREEAPAR